MAQELIDKIRAQAQARNLDPDTAVRIAQIESSLNPAARAKTSSAEGLFQVVDDTWRQFKGAPGQKRNPDENIRVGLDILSSNTRTLKSALGREPSPSELYAAHFLGPQGATSVLTAAPDTPVEQLLSARAIKANPQLKGKVAGTLLADLQAKMGDTGSRPTAQPQPAPAALMTDGMESVPVGISAQVQPPKAAEMGTGYQAALALSFLGDEEDKGEKEEKDKEGPSAAQMLAEYKPKNYLSEIDWDKSSLVKPVKMAEGGEVEEPSLLRLQGYSENVARDMYPGQQGQFDQQDAARHMLAAGTMSRKYGPGVAEFAGQAHEILTSPGKWIGSKLGISRMPVDYEQDLHNNRLGIELAKRSKSQKELEDLVQAEAERAQRMQTPGAAWIERPKRPIKRAAGSPEGGENAEPTPEELEAASRPAFVTPKSGIGRKTSATSGQINDAALQGVSEMPYNLVGAPVDIATMALRPFGYAVDKPVMGSDWIKGKMTAAGIRPEPPKEPGARAIYEVMQLGSSAINPAAPVRGAVAAGRATEKAAKDLMQDFQAYNRELAVPGASYAVKPKGGVFAYTPDLPSPPATYLNELLDTYVTRAVSERAPDEVVDFIRKKAPKYFTSVYGTADDPLRTALRTVRVEPFGRDASRLPPYLVDAAANPNARGHLQAKIDLEKAYDEATGIEAFRLRPPGEQSGRYDIINKQLAAEGVPREAQNPPYVIDHTREEFLRYPSSTRVLREMDEFSNLPQHLRQALDQGDLIYDVNPRLEMLGYRNVIEALQEIPGDKLKNMSFPEALVQGTKALEPIRDYEKAIDIASRGARPPKEAMLMFTKPVIDTPRGEWVQLEKPIATRLEGKLMNHSVGGYADGNSYGTMYTGLPVGGKEAFDKDLVRVYSLRDKTGAPKVTVEVAKTALEADAPWAVTQVRGRFNSEPPEEMRTSIFDLFDRLSTRDNLANIRSNSYTKDAQGADAPATHVEWGREFDLWKSQFDE